jgi:transposase-like protein
MMAEQRKTYTTEFKREAVRTANTQRAFPGNGRLTPDQEELRQLRDEVKRLRMARDISRLL